MTATATEKQIKFLETLLKKKKFTDAFTGDLPNLSKGEASALISWLMTNPTAVTPQMGKFFGVVPDDDEEDLPF